MRNPSSWGMHQLEIFNEKKSSFSKTMYLTKRHGVADRAEDIECAMFGTDNIPLNKKCFKLKKNRLFPKGSAVQGIESQL